MKLFLKDIMGFVILYIVSFIALVFLYKKLDGFEQNMGYFIFLSSFLLFCFLIYRYISNRQLYRKLSEKPEHIEDMLTQDAHSELEKAFSKSMQEYMKLYNSEINSLENAQKEYKIMLNQWVHQMKTPISVINLLAENNMDNTDFQKVIFQTQRLDYDLLQILTFLRMDDFAKDMKIENINLKETVLQVVNELKEFFIIQSVFPKVSIPTELIINTDKKWFKYAIYQIINNAIKYSDKNKIVNISSYMENDMIILKIRNEGVGIKKSDINRVFDLFFTGDNGRTFGESTGVGLYIVKKIMDLLQHKIYVESQTGEQTTFYMHLKP
ncbi:sensor histidine kinase [Clostridium tagluense]|uniref:sensor histidine kinase n=1 Tax=Clostridium tagluense TaxID=360422 RepID=UPI001CF17A18|nr:sensor histidine kinase [Clostridium tagluense]MCB2296257.1 sensor histidine kinase [Clostridium tagluense]